MHAGRWTRRLALSLLAAALAALSAGPARAAYQATIDVNKTAFSPACIGINDTYPAKMLTAAVAGYRALGYAASGFSGASFTRAHVLGRAIADFGYYVHSHGDFYGGLAGFREDAGLCSGARVVTSSDIGSARAGRKANLVFMSTCHLGETATTMPEAFGIAKRKARSPDWAGPSFYVGYIGETWDSDEYAFETRFWSAIGPGFGAGQAFDIARLGSFNPGFAANWFGSYDWTGRAGSLPTCPRCT